MRALGWVVVASALSAVACGDTREEVGIGLNWMINRTGQGTVTCLDVSAATVEWTFRSMEEGLDDALFTYDCVDSGQSELIDSGRYDVTAKLKRGDGVVLGQCEPEVAAELKPTDNQVDQCIFEVQ